MGGSNKRMLPRPITMRICLAAICLQLTPAVGVSVESANQPSARIDRRALVTRHNPVLRRFDPESPLSVGNGEFAFTADVTGLQTFAESYVETIPLGTLSQWGWHTAPNPDGWSIDRFGFAEFESHGRRVGYADIPGNRRTPEIEWLRGNPHRLHLGRIGFRLSMADDRLAEATDLTDVRQVLDLWNGVLLSRFRLEGQPVEVQTVCHPVLDLLAVRVTSPLLPIGRIRIQIAFPYGTGNATAADWSRPDAHQSVLSLGGPNRATIARRLDGDAYYVSLAWTSSTALDEAAKHTYRLNGHNHQRPGLTIYLPGNGGLLYAVAMMAAGWDGAPKKHAPGSPDDGQWVVRFEGLLQAP